MTNATANYNQGQWVWNPETKSYDPISMACHSGNTKLYTEPNGGSLFIGGWTKGAHFDWNTHVIDLTGLEHKYNDSPVAYDEVSKGFLPYLQNSYAGWLSLPFPDYNTPKNLTTYEQWKGIAEHIQKILQDKKDVLVACHGGHGRSGLFCSIVGYILGINSNRAWSSPVEHIRKVHCDDAVETRAQEKYVYDILGLDIQITHTYFTNYSSTSKNCPICDGLSVYVDDFGMCMSCKNKYELTAPVVTDLTLDNIDNPMEHRCVEGENCIGIYKASKCGHTTHNMIVYDGLCEICAWEEEHRNKKEGKGEENKTTETKGIVENEEDDDIATGYAECCMCHRKSMWAKKYGICYDCQVDLRTMDKVDFVHNSIVDPYRAVAHACDADVCVGIACADVCHHITHNKEIEDGLCEDCIAERNARNE